MRPRRRRVGSERVRAFPTMTKGQVTDSSTELSSAIEHHKAGEKLKMMKRKTKSDKDIRKAQARAEAVQLAQQRKEKRQEEIEAKIFPDVQLIHDMITCHNEHWVEISETEYLAEANI